MASSRLTQQQKSNNRPGPPATLLAVVVVFDNTETKLLSDDRRDDSPSQALKDYCSKRRNGGCGDISLVIYPWQADETRGLVIFDNEFAPPGSNINKVAAVMVATLLTYYYH